MYPPLPGNEKFWVDSAHRSTPLYTVGALPYGCGPHAHLACMRCIDPPQIQQMLRFREHPPETNSIAHISRSYTSALYTTTPPPATPTNIPNVRSYSLPLTPALMPPSSLPAIPITTSESQSSPKLGRGSTPDPYSSFNAKILAHTESIHANDAGTQ